MLVDMSFGFFFFVFPRPDASIPGSMGVLREFGRMRQAES